MTVDRRRAVAGRRAWQATAIGHVVPLRHYDAVPPVLLIVPARDLRVGDRIVGFTPDADAGITDVEVMASGGVVLSLVVIDHDGQDIAGSTAFIAHPDTAYTVQRRVYR